MNSLIPILLFIASVVIVASAGYTLREPVENRVTENIDILCNENLRLDLCKDLPMMNINYSTL